MKVFAVLVLAAALLLSSCNAALNPYHAYLSLTGNLSEMQLTFTTTSAPPSASVEYALSSSPSEKKKISATKDDTVLYVTPFGRHEYITSLTMTDLKADADYAYSIYCDESQPPEKNSTFKTLPSVDDPIGIVMYGDLGAEGAILTTKTGGNLLAWAKARKMDFIIHYGDLAYNLDTNKGDIGDRFMTNIESISTILPYVVTAGNHEYAGPDHASEKMFRGWFRGQTLLGERSQSSDPEMWHSYDIGEKLHLVGINTEVYCEDNEHVTAQWNWLKKDLETVRSRSVQPWIVVYGHRQLYDGTDATFHQKLMRYGVECEDASHTKCNMSKPCYSGKNCAYSLEELFDDHYIDLYMAGHMHYYNRMFPIARDTKYETQDRSTYINAQSPVYVVSGAAGAANHTHSAIRMVRDTTSRPSVVYSDVHGFSKLTVYNTTHLRLQQIQLDDTLEDEFWMIKDTSKPKWTKTASFTLMGSSLEICDQ
jgi:hypothetical protein